MIKKKPGLLVFMFFLMSAWIPKSFAGPTNTKFDSLSWEISIFGGPNNLNVSRFQADNQESNSGFLNLRLAREFSSIFQMQVQVGYGTLKLNDKPSSAINLPSSNPVQMFHYGSGFVLNFNRSNFQPYFNFGFGLVNYSKGSFIKENNQVVELEEERGVYSQVGFGLKMISKKGIGVKAEINCQQFSYPNVKGFAANSNDSYMSGVQFGIGLVKLL